MEYCQGFNSLRQLFYAYNIGYVEQLAFLKYLT
jgi:hypothetical protein